MQVRIDKLADSPGRDATQQPLIDAIEGEYADLLDELDPLERDRADVREIGWLVEELRISLFAQSVGTAQTVSAKRVRKAMAEVRASLRPHA